MHSRQLAREAFRATVTCLWFFEAAGRVAGFTVSGYYAWAMAPILAVLLAVMWVGNRIGDISATIQAFVESHGFSVVREMVGHGVGEKMHEPPEIPNFGRKGTGEKIRPGMTLAIEPMVNLGTYGVRTKARPRIRSE